MKTEVYKDVALIMGGPHIRGNTKSAKKCYVREAQARHCQVSFAVEQRPSKTLKSGSEPITFTSEDARCVMFPHNDPLVISAIIRNQNLHQIFVDNASSIDIHDKETFSRLGLKK